MIVFEAIGVIVAFIVLYVLVAAAAEKLFHRNDRKW